MGFFFRKSIGFGPFRLNLSKSGVGVSTGIKGARVWTGPRGTYVQVGRKGFYYRQKLGDFGSHPTPARTVTSEKPSQSEWHDNSVDLPHGKVIESIKAPPKNPAALNIHIGYLFLTVVSIAGIAWYVSSSSTQSTADANRASWLLFIVPPTVWGIGACIHYFAKLKAGRPLPYPLYYRLDDQRSSRFSTIAKALEALKQSQYIWSLTQGQTPALVGIQSPPLIVTNVDVWAISILNWKMFFMPDSIYVFTNGTYSIVPYEDLRFSYSEQRVYAVHGHPQDATVVDRTWAHTRKDGYPDRRYKYNPSIPIVLYGLVKLESRSGWTMALQTSSRDSARRCVSLISVAIPGFRNEKTSGQQSYNRQNNYEYRKRPPASSQSVSQKSAYEVLGVKEGASMEEVTAAYHKQAQMNHPDRVASMAPEFRELAERRMKEINAAYSELTKRSQ
jgi:hypothetical protein